MNLKKKRNFVELWGGSLFPPYYRGYDFAHTVVLFRMVCLRYKTPPAVDISILLQEVFLSKPQAWYIIGLRLDLFTKVWYNKLTDK